MPTAFATSRRIYASKLVVSNIDKGRTRSNMPKPVQLILLFILIATKLTAQATATASASVTIVSPLSVEASLNTTTIQTETDKKESATNFSRSSKKLLNKASFLLPLLKKKITYASLRISNASVYDVSIPDVVLLKNATCDQTITAYCFKHDLSINAGTNNANPPIQLSALVAIAPDQIMGVYQSKAIRVVVNYN